MVEPTPPPPALVQEELLRLIDGDALRRAPSHARLLRYLVERQIAGDEMALRETSIALEVFRRDPSTFDPQHDPIVRVATGRLRDRLDTHYASYDTPPKLRIILPKGRYAPEFVALACAVPASPGLAVLRTRNHTGDDTFDGVGHAFSDQLADRLASAGLPRVLARAAVDSAQAHSNDPTALGAQLEVPWLLESTLSREQRRALRLSVRLVDALDASVRWVESSAADADDIYRLIERMLDRVTLRTFETLPAGAGLRALEQPLTSLPGPLHAALEQAHLLLLQRGVEATDKATALAAAVTHACPDVPDGWATLAAAQYSRLSFLDCDHQPIVADLRATLARALELDPEQPMALRTLAILLGKCDFDAAAAEDLFRRTLRTMPHYTSARINYAELLTLVGNFDESLAQLSLARLHDPLSATVHLARATCLGYQRRYTDARNAWALCRATGESSLWNLTGAAMNELALGDLDAAAALVGDAMLRFPDMPMTIASLACLHAARGDTVLAQELERECVARFPHFPKSQRALLAALRRDRDSTLRLLDDALTGRDMELLAVTLDPAFDWLEDDADFRKLRSRCAIWAERAETTTF